MPASNKLPVACLRDDWALLFVLLSLYYYRGFAFIAVLRPERARGRSSGGLPTRVRARGPASDSFLPIVRGTRPLFTTLSIIARQWTRAEFLKTRDTGSASVAPRGVRFYAVNDAVHDAARGGGLVLSVCWQRGIRVTLCKEVCRFRIESADFFAVEDVDSWVFIYPICTHLILFEKIVDCVRFGLIEFRLIYLILLGKFCEVWRFIINFNSVRLIFILNVVS